MGELIVQTDGQEIDQKLLTRVLLGALSEHEQRLLGVRLLHRDADLRMALLSILPPFEMYDLDLLAEYAAVLDRGQAVERERHRILARAYARATDLEAVIRDFTFGEALESGRTASKIFSWSMSEFLLERSRRVGMSDYNMRISLYLALMVIDGVEILGAAGHSAQFPNVVRDVRERLEAAAVEYRKKSPPEGVLGGLGERFGGGWAGS